MVCDRVPLFANLPEELWLRLCLFADDKEGGFDPIVSENLKKPKRMMPTWPVIER